MAKTQSEAYEFSDAERRDIIKLINEGKPLPDKHRFLYVDQESFKRHQPRTFAALAASFTEYQRMA